MSTDGSEGLEVDEPGARLSEIDRKLGELQAELLSPGDLRGPIPGSAIATEQARAQASAFPAGGRSGPLERVMLRASRQSPSHEAGLGQRDRELAEFQADLLGSLREILSALQPRVTRARPSDEELTVSAGPFHTVEEVRAFERELAGLPGVRAAALRGYEGSDRVVIDVQLER